MIREPRLLLCTWVGLLWLSACSDDATKPTTQAVCHDSLSGACVPCAGVAGCVQLN